MAQRAVDPKMTACPCSVGSGWHTLIPVAWREDQVLDAQHEMVGIHRKVVAYRCQNCGEPFMDSDLPQRLTHPETPAGEQPFPWETSKV